MNPLKELPTQLKYFSVWEKAWLEGIVEGDFEGRKVPLPVGYDKVLTCQYGDYMQLPPEEKRRPSHQY